MLILLQQASLIMEFSLLNLYLMYANINLQEVTIKDFKKLTSQNTSSFSALVMLKLQLLTTTLQTTMTCISKRQTTTINKTLFTCKCKYRIDKVVL